MAFKGNLAAALDTLPSEALERCAVEISEHHGKGQLAEELSAPLNALTDLLSEEYILSQREPFIRHLDYQLPNRSSLPFDVRCRTVMRLLREWINRIMQMVKPASSLSSSRRPRSNLSYGIR